MLKARRILPFGLWIVLLFAQLDVPDVAVGESAIGTTCDPLPNWGGASNQRSGSCENSEIPGQVSNWGKARARTVALDASVAFDGQFSFTEFDIDLADLQLAEEVGQALGEMGSAPSINFGVTSTNLDQIGEPLDPRWANVNQWDQEILAAQAQVLVELNVLVPANVIKAVMMIETQGIVPEGANYAGARGLMQVTPLSMGASIYEFDRIDRDPPYSVYCGTYELAMRYEHSGRLPWRNVIVGYFSGHYEPTGTADAYNTDFQYQEAFDGNMAELTAAAARVIGAPSALPGTISGHWLEKVGQPISGLSYLWQNSSVAGQPAGLTQEFGPTDWSRGEGRWMYEYASSYGFLEPGHTGLDINIVAGTPLYAPFDGLIACAGTNNGPAPGSSEPSCAAFASDYGGPMSGRLELELSNGDVVIFGHVNETRVPLGSRVRAGDLIGISGGQFGDHLHLEYRTPDPSTVSKWRIVDPRRTTLNLLAVFSGPSVAGVSRPDEPVVIAAAIRVASLRPGGIPLSKPAFHLDAPPRVRVSDRQRVSRRKNAIPARSIGALRTRTRRPLSRRPARLGNRGASSGRCPGAY